LAQKLQTSASEEPSLSAKYPHWTNTLLPDCGRLSWTAHKQNETNTFTYAQANEAMLYDSSVLYQSCMHNKHIVVTTARNIVTKKRSTISCNRKFFFFAGRGLGHKRNQTGDT